MPEIPSEETPDTNHRLGKFVKQWVREVVVRSRPLTSLDSGTLDKLLARLPSTHHLDGAASDDVPPILMFRCHNGVPAASLTNEVRFLAWAWPSRFGACMTLTAYGRNRIISRISLDQESEAFRHLQSGQFIAVFESANQAVAAFDVDLAATQLGKEQFSDHWQAANSNDNKVPSPRDRDATYRKAVEHNKTLAKLLTPHDRLSCGWIRAFHALSRYADELLSKLSDSVTIRDYQSVELPEIAVEFFDAVTAANKNLTKVYDHFRAKMAEPGWLVRFIECFSSLQNFEESSPYISGMLFVSFLHTSALTKSGLALPWLDGADGGKIRQLELEPEQFASTAVEDYWARLPESFFIDWGLLISGHDVSMSPAELQQGWSTVKLETEIQEVEASIDSLLEEAVGNRKWTIPPHALVELKFGPFAFCEIVELPHEIYFILRDAQWRFCIGSVSPATRCWAIQVGEDEPGVRQKEVNTATKLLLAAILRDFWVVEERESVFSGTALPKRLAKQSKGEDDETIVYLPRVHYKTKPNLQNCAASLDYKERRQHFVVAHLRRVEESSKGQRLLAEVYGFKVPTGYTFVRPHERGHKKKEVIYRSRSALRSLYTAVEEGSKNQRPRWFQFERDVYSLMKKLGYDVEHVSASRRGDHGIDVYATRLGAETMDNWVIQCKCYNPQHKVGPNTIRELSGSLSRYEAATKGMVVTTSTFTPGAIEEANRVGIRLINGSEFLKSLGENK